MLHDDDHHQVVRPVHSRLTSRLDHTCSSVSDNRPDRDLSQCNNRLPTTPDTLVTYSKQSRPTGRTHQQHGRFGPTLNSVRPRLYSVARFFVLVITGTLCMESAYAAFSVGTPQQRRFHVPTARLSRNDRKRLDDQLLRRKSYAANQPQPQLLELSASTVDTESEPGQSSSPEQSQQQQEEERRLTVGAWEELHGNFLLRPPNPAQQPRALIHFLGGAIVGAAPHLSYRYLLEKLAAQGYIIVATPYDLSFDHLQTCDQIITRFERIAPLLARTYGGANLPVVGVGHSCGALLQLLITSLFPDTPRAANALISFNNKPVSEAVPFFESVVAPFFVYAGTATAGGDKGATSSEVLSVGLKLAKSAAIGRLPSDELLSQAIDLIKAGPPLPFPLPKIPFGEDKSSVQVPQSIRDAVSTLSDPTIKLVSENTELLPLITETLETLEQVPKLINEVADGARDFVPTPQRVKIAAQRAYRARRTLILQYTDDPLDESDELEELLTVAGQVIRMKRPMVTNIDVQRRNIGGTPDIRSTIEQRDGDSSVPGIITDGLRDVLDSLGGSNGPGHAAPLLAPPLEVAEQAETLLGADTAKDIFMYRPADDTVNELVRWLEESSI